MRFRVERDEFADAVGWVARGLPSRPAVPVLAGVLLDVAADRVSVSAFDHETSSQVGLAAVDTVSGQALVSGHLLAPIARTLPDHPVEVSVEASRARLRCGPVRFNLPLMPVEDRPVPPVMPTVAGRVAGADFAAAVARVAIAAGRDEALPMLTGIQVALSADTLSLSATDRYRLAVAELPWESAQPGLARSTGAVLVPARVLADTAKALVTAPTITVCLDGAGLTGTGGGMIGIRADGRRTTARLLDARFPRLDSLWPPSYPTIAVLPARELIEAIGRVCLVAGPHAPVRLSCQPGSVRVSAGEQDGADSAEGADGEQELAAEVSGEPVLVSFIPAYLLDGLRAAGTEVVRLSLTQSGKPAMITAGPPAEPTGTPGFRYLAMSLRVR